MSTNKTDRDNWRKFLGIKEPSATLDANRVGVDIGKSYGRSGGASSGGEIDADEIPEGDDEQGAEKGDGAGDAGEKLKVGDELDRLEDLYDCETGEVVKIDGLGEKGSEQYPTGFENCEGDKKPTLEDLIANNVTIYRNSIKYYVPSGQKIPQDARFYYDSASSAESGLSSLKPIADSFARSHSQHGCGISILPNGQGGLSRYMAISMWRGNYGTGSCAPTIGYAAEVFGVSHSDSVEWKQAYLDNWQDNWPAVDKNHLTWNKEKGCFEPLCPELNNQVLDKYKACEPERILCDKDGNKVKVEVDGNTVKVTQAKYNQTAEIKNGKVQSVKKLTESQTEAEFK